MNRINFYDKERSLIMSFSDFSIIDEDLEKIKFTINLSFGFFNISVDTEIYISYLQHFTHEIQVLYNNIPCEKQAEFIPIERDVDILLESGCFGDISVRIKLYYDNMNHNANGVLECNYTIDQSFLPELIEELESMVISLTGNNLKI